MDPQKSILMIIPWFGKWPAWMRFFVESCRANPTIDWLIPTDCGGLADLPDNIRLLHTSLLEYRDFIARRLEIDCSWDEAYKLCDLKPTLGFIHADKISRYDYWGFGDLDLIYGDIRSIYTSDVLTHDVISTHSDRCSGHFALVRNIDSMNRAFARVRGWRQLLGRKAHASFDEHHWSNLFIAKQDEGWKARLKNRLRSPRLRSKGYFVEQFSTSLPPLQWIDGTQNYPHSWIWREGKLTADNAGERTFLYAHFSNWQSGRWLRSGEAAWKDLPALDHCPPGRLTGFAVSAGGFRPLLADVADIAAE